MIIEASQSPANWEGHIGNHAGLGVEVEKEVSEAVYEEIDISNTPFTMEYNISYSTVKQTAM